MPSPGENGIGYGRFARLVKLAGVTVVVSSRLPPKARFFGAPPRFFAQEQRNGVERAVGVRDFYPTKRRTRTKLRHPPAPPQSRARNVPSTKQ